MAKIYNHTTFVGIHLDVDPNQRFANTRAERHEDHLNGIIKWVIPFSDETYQFDIWNIDVYNGWWKIVKTQYGTNHSIKCDTPDCELQYQKLLRKNKLKRILK